MAHYLLSNDFLLHHSLMIFFLFIFSHNFLCLQFSLLILSHDFISPSTLMIFYVFSLKSVITLILYTLSLHTHDFFHFSFPVMIVNLSSLLYFFVFLLSHDFLSPHTLSFICSFCLFELTLSNFSLILPIY